MRNLILAFLIVLSGSTALHAADVKITDLPSTTAPASTDVMPVVTNPSTTAVTKKTTIANLLKNATFTVAGTSGEIDSSAGSQDLSTARTWTLSLPSAINFTSKNVRLPNATSLVSADCDNANEAGRIFIDTDATTGNQMYVCEGVTGWVQQAGGGGGAGTVSTSTANAVAIYDAAGSTVVGSSILTDDNTNVGIGSPNPTQKLDVAGSIKASTDILVGAQSVCQEDGTNCPASAPAAPAGTTGAIQYNNSGTTAGDATKLSFNGTNVGIGTTNGTAGLDVRVTTNFNGVNVGIGSLIPGQKLDVQGTVRATTFVGALTGNATTSSSTTGNAATATALATPRAINGVAFDGSAPITVTAAGSTLTGTVLASNIVTSSLTSVGNLTANVGIGSAAPGAALDVTGTIRASSDIKVASLSVCRSDGTNCPSSISSPWIITTGVGIGTTGNVGVGTTHPSEKFEVVGTGKFTTVQAGSGTGIISGDSNGNIGIGTSSASTKIAIGPTGQIRMDSNGNLGVGTVAPPQKLYVAGTAEVQGFKMNLNPSAGYVLTSSSVGVGTWMPASGGSGSGTVSSGTADRIAIYDTAGTTVSSSTKLFDDGTNVGIGTIAPRSAVELGVQIVNIVGSNVGIGSLSPGQVLDVNGAIRSIGSGDSTLNTTGGNVGIGSLTPGAKLDVTGGVRFSGNLVGIGTLSVGASLGTAANQACNTTCSTGACLMGLDLVAGFVDCATATADTCICLSGTGG